MSKRDKGKLNTPESEDYYAGNDSRKQNESNEGHASATSDAPKTRYQERQQVVPSSEAEKITPPESSFVKRESKTTGSTIKQEVASKVAVADADFAGPAAVSAPSRAGLRTMSYSGDSGTIIGSAANTPVVASTDRNSDSGRFERKLDAPNKKINYLASEQVVEEYDNPAPLGESGNEVQGYYGTPKNASARSQKSTGCHPGDPLFQRSLDVITRDEIVFIVGQLVKREGVNYTTLPTQKSTWIDGKREPAAYDGEAMYGNFLPRTLEFVLTKSANGVDVTSMQFTDVVDGSCEAGDAVVNAASTNLPIQINKAELARQNIDSKAGRETEANWSPLGRAIEQPSQTSLLLSTIEAETGATIAAAYRFASKSLSYQLNKAAKDGQHLVRPMREALTGAIADNITSADFADDGLYGFDPLSNKTEKGRAALQNGSAATMILLNDSPSKYSSKGMLLTAPKSLRQYIQVADNNMNVFRLPKECGAAMNAYDVFSTIDHEYDPLQPVCVTDKMGLMYAINPQSYSSYTVVNGQKQYVQNAGPYSYAYANRSSNYQVIVDHPLWAGIDQFVSEHATKLYSILTNDAGNGSVTWRIPIVHSTCTFSLFDFLVLASVPYMQKKRINSMRDVLDFEVNFEYPYDLMAIREYNPTNAVNYVFSDIDHPLETKIMIPSVAVTWQLPEFFWGIGENTSGTNASMYVSPFYFNEHQFESIKKGSSGSDRSTSTGYDLKDMMGTMSFPIVRSGVRLASLDALYSMTERDLRLCLDRLVTVPGERVSGDDSYAVYKYSQSSDGIPVFKGGFTISEFISAPRELGWHMVAQNGVLRNRDNLKYQDTPISVAGNGFFTTRKAAATDDVTSETSYRAYCWYGNTAYDNSILAETSVLINRAQAFEQNWDCSPAARMDRPGAPDTTAYKNRRDIGFLLSFNGSCGIGSSNQVAFLTNGGYFHPFTSGLTAAGGQYGQQVQLTSTLFSCVGLAKALWGRMQRLPFALSPWDTCDFTGSAGAQFDPYDFLYMLGMAGTMASDYNQDLYDRVNEVQYKGWLYTADPFVAASPVYKDSFKYSMVG